MCSVNLMAIWPVVVGQTYPSSGPAATRVKHQIKEKKSFRVANDVNNGFSHSFISVVFQTKDVDNWQADGGLWLVDVHALAESLSSTVTKWTVDHVASNVNT